MEHGYWDIFSCIVLSTFIICLSCLAVCCRYFHYKGNIKSKELEHEEKMKDKEWKYNQDRENKIHGWTSIKTTENLELEIKSLKEEKEKQEQCQKEKDQRESDRIAFMMYVLANKKDATLDMEKLSKEVENFKKVYKEFENYLKTNQ